MKITKKMKNQFIEARRNIECVGQLQNLEGSILLKDLEDKYGKNGVREIAKALDKEELK